MSEGEFLVRDTRLPGHFWADNEVYDAFGKKLGAYAFAVYMALCRKAKNVTGECSVSMSQLAEDLDVSRATIHGAVTRIIDLGLAMRTLEGGPRQIAMYVLADVKSLVDPVHASQLRLGTPPSSVHIANAKKQPIVRLMNAAVNHANAAVNQANAAFAIRHPNKERKTSLKTYKTNNTEPCSFCNETGLRDHKGHPGRQFFCHCEKGLQLHQQDKAIDHVPTGRA